jgi:hypothetical protein
LFAASGGYDPTKVANAANPLYGGASSLFDRAAAYLGQSPEEVSAKYIADQQALLEPGRQAGFNRLQTSNFGRGTSGLGVNTGTGGAPANPLAQAYFNQIGQQDLELAANADKAAMDRARFGAGLFGTGGDLLKSISGITTAGYAPLEASLGLMGTTERLGQDPYRLSLDLADRYSSAGARAADLYLRPQGAAASAYREYQGYSPMGSALSGAGSTLSGGGGSWFGDLLSSGTSSGGGSRPSTYDLYGSSGGTGGGFGLRP